LPVEPFDIPVSGAHRCIRRASAATGCCDTWLSAQGGPWFNDELFVIARRA
jgi:hypothetical protein